MPLPALFRKRPCASKVDIAGEGKIKNMSRESDREGGGKERWGEREIRGEGKEGGRDSRAGGARAK